MSGRRPTAPDAVKALRLAWDQAVTAIGEMTDPVEAFQEATELQDWVAGLSETVARLRADQVKRKWDRDRLNLAALGQVFGRSKGWAGQMMKAAQERDTP